MTEEHLRWAEALTIIRQHGPGAPRWVAERISSLACASDVGGVERFRAIALRVEQALAAQQSS